MADEVGRSHTSSDNAATRTRKVRPEIQIYRPGMMRKGADVAASDAPQNDSKSLEISRQPKRQSRAALDSSHRTEKEYENTARRRSNDTDSIHSYYGDSGSTTPDAASISSERHECVNRVTSSRGFPRGGISANRQTCGSEDFKNPASFNKRSAGDYKDRENPRMPHVQRNRGVTNDRVPSSNYSYNSTQSLYDPHHAEGYLNYRSSYERRRGNADVGRAPSPVRFRRKNQHTERSSMRAEGGRRNAGNRKRNDSVNSTQSECLPQLPSRLPVDAMSETQSIGGDEISSSSLSYIQLCQSFESLGSFDWSKEVESEYNAKHSGEAEQKSSERLEDSKYDRDSSQKDVVQDISNSNSLTRGILRVPHELRCGRERILSDSDRSSIRGSIVEEEGNSSEASSGECTPTEESGDEKHWNNRKERRVARTTRDGPRSSGCNSNSFMLSGNKSSRLAGRVTIDRSIMEPNKAETTSPLTPRVSRVSLRNETRKPYKPPVMRVSTKNGAVSASDDVRDSKSTPLSSSQSQKMTDYPIYHQITNNEGPRMQKINDSIASLLFRVQKRDLKAAEKVIELSGELCEIYYKLLPRDISFTFTMNLEQHLWKQAFYKPIEVFKSVVNSPKDSSRSFRAALLLLLNNGISFYTRLLHLYEKELQVDLEKVLLFRFEQSDAFWNVCTAPNTESCKIATKSYSRHLISLGDLNRYKALIEGSEDYSKARAMYLRSAQLWPASGHSYNQLAVVAYFSGHALDEIFYCVRALSAGHPFEVARDRLYARLAAMKRKVDKYEPLLDLECGEVKEDAELAASADRPYELWLDTEGSDIEPNDGDAHIFQSFLDQQPSKLHRRVVCYVINTVGLLITKIGMESFPSVSERSIAQLAALVEQESSPVTAGQLIQIVALFIYAVHCNAIVGEEDVCSVQQQQAVRTLVSVFGALLRPITLRLQQISTWIKNPTEVPHVVSRVFPALCVLCEWFSCPLASGIYRTMPSVEPLSLSVIEIDTWHFLAEIANELIRWQDGGQLVKIQNSTDANCSCLLPELAFISSFSSVFPSSPRVLHYTGPSTESMETNIPLQIRLAQLLLAAEYLDGSELSCFFFCEKTGRFTRREHIDGPDREQPKLPSVDQNEETPDSSPPLSREELLERELRKHEKLLVVKPYYVVVDTNAFIDQLCAIQKILQCERFRVLIPTTVVEELIELQHGDQGSARVEAVTEGARQAITWLREQVRQKPSRLFTLTMRGRRLPIAVVRENAGDDGDLVNDDRILHSCLNYTQLEPAPEGMFSNFKVPQGREIPIIYRNLVLITDDRVLNMKAMSQHIPCRTVTRFMKWAKIS